MTNLTKTLMMAAVAIALLAVLQVAASAQPLTPRELSMTSGHANITMASDRDRGRDFRGGDRDRGDRDRGNWRGSWGDRDDHWFRGDSGWNGPGSYGYGYNRDWDHHHDNDNKWLIPGALLGLYLLTR
jgi:hypothetical protein